MRIKFQSHKESFCIRLLVMIFVFFIATVVYSQTIINMKKNGGVYLVPCTMNGLKLDFIFDTGASDVTISLSEALFMLKNGYMKEEDLIGTTHHKLANGEVAEGTKIIIRTLEVGGIILSNVEASIVHNIEAPLLLGQSAIERFGAYSVDYANNTIALGIKVEKLPSTDDIVSKYIEVNGGKAAWDKLTGTRMKAHVDYGGMTLPLDIIHLKDGRQYTSFEMQGKKMVQNAFDGKVSWGINFMTMKPEKNDAETTENIKRESKDFLDPFMIYKERGYKAELMGKEMAEGVNCFKIKLTKKTQLHDGKEEDNIVYYYIDAENYINIMVEVTISSGEAKGQVSQTVFSDYQQVEGIYFPFSIMSRIKDGQGQTVIVESVELNPKVDDSLFKFPEQ